MDMHHISEFGEGGVFAHQDTDLLNDVGSMCTVSVTAEDFTIMPSLMLRHVPGLQGKYCRFQLFFLLFSIKKIIQVSHI